MINLEPTAMDALAESATEITSGISFLLLVMLLSVQIVFVLRVVQVLIFIARQILFQKFFLV